MTANVEAMANELTRRTGKLVLPPGVLYDMQAAAVSKVLLDYKIAYALRENVTIVEASKRVEERRDWFREVLIRATPFVRAMFFCVPAEANVKITKAEQEDATTRIYTLYQFAIFEYERIEQAMRRAQGSAQ